jgi:hypothetical protein
MRKKTISLVSPAPDWLVEKIVGLSLQWKRLARRKKREAQREEELANRTLAKCYSDCADQLEKAVRAYLRQNRPVESHFRVEGFIKKRSR